MLLTNPKTRRSNVCMHPVAGVVSGSYQIEDNKIIISGLEQDMREMGRLFLCKYN